MWIKSIKNTFHWIQACFGVHTLHKSLISLLKRFSSFMDSFRVKIVYTRSISLFENFPRIMIKKCEKHLILEIFYLREKTFFSSHFWSAHQIMLEHPPSFFSFEAYLSCGLWGQERSFVSFPSFLAIFAFFLQESNLSSMADTFYRTLAYSLSEGVSVSAIDDFIRN